MISPLITTASILGLMIPINRAQTPNSGDEQGNGFFHSCSILFTHTGITDQSRWESTWWLTTACERNVAIPPPDSSDKNKNRSEPDAAAGGKDYIAANTQNMATHWEPDPTVSTTRQIVVSRLDLRQCFLAGREGEVIPASTWDDIPADNRSRYRYLGSGCSCAGLVACPDCMFNKGPWVGSWGPHAVWWGCYCEWNDDGDGEEEPQGLWGAVDLDQSLQNLDGQVACLTIDGIYARGDIISVSGDGQSTFFG